MADWRDKYQEFKQSEWSPTELKPEENEQYRKDVFQSKWFKDTKKRHPDQSNDQVLNDQEAMGHYDLKGAWQQGMFKQSDKSAANKYDNVHHLSDAGAGGKMLKSPDHPTAWMEFFQNQHGKDPESMGLKTYEDAVNWQSEQDQKADYAHRIYPDNP